MTMETLSLAARSLPRKLFVEVHSGTIERLMGLIAYIWGLLLVYPIAFSSLPIYQDMAKIAPEWVWGSGILLAGAWQIAAALSETKTHRIRAAQFTSVMWAFIAGGILHTNLFTSALGVYPSFSAFNLWIVANVSAEASSECG